jgi:hypothetical protein
MQKFCIPDRWTSTAGIEGEQGVQIMSFDIGRLTGRIAFAVAAACGLLAGAGGAAAQTPFYQASEAEIAGPPGTVIRQEPMVGAAASASAYRVLYRSTRPDGAPIAVSGVIIIPAGEAPAGGWPIVAWAHPTTGIVPRCAPSLAIFIFQQIAGSRELLEQGYAIAATDYPGLGTSGPHPYLVGVSEARAVIDSVRAARSFPGMQNSNRYAVWGHSQGGQAALFTGMISKTYAPELRLIGVAAAAPRDRPSDAHDRRHQHGRRQKSNRHDRVVMGAGVRRTDRQRCGARGHAGSRSSRHRVH